MLLYYYNSVVCCSNTTGNIAVFVQNDFFCITKREKTNSTMYCITLLCTAQHPFFPSLCTVCPPFFEEPPPSVGKLAGAVGQGTPYAGHKVSKWSKADPGTLIPWQLGSMTLAQTCWSWLSQAQVLGTGLSNFCYQKSKSCPNFLTLGLAIQTFLGLYKNFLSLSQVLSLICQSLCLQMQPKSKSDTHSWKVYRFHCNLYELLPGAVHIHTYVGGTQLALFLWYIWIIPKAIIIIINDSTMLIITFMHITFSMFWILSSKRFPEVKLLRQRAQILL